MLHPQPRTAQVAPAAASPCATKGVHGDGGERGFLSADGCRKGMVKGAAGTLANIDEAARKHLPAFMTKQWFGSANQRIIEKEEAIRTATEYWREDRQVRRASR